jgi:hypothetical protein
LGDGSSEWTRTRRRCRWQSRGCQRAEPSSGTGCSRPHRSPNDEAIRPGALQPRPAPDVRLGRARLTRSAAERSGSRPSSTNRPSRMPREALSAVLRPLGPLCVHKPRDTLTIHVLSVRARKGSPARLILRTWTMAWGP